MIHKSLKNKLSFCVVAMISVFIANCSAALVDSSHSKYLISMSNQLKKYVISKDIASILKYVNDGGVYFIDGHFTKAEINTYLNDNDSWLYKYLFVGDNSISSRLKNSEDSSVEVFQRGDDAILVKYVVNGSELDVENCLINIGGHWYFDGVFDCN